MKYHSLMIFGNLFPDFARLYDIKSLNRNQEMNHDSCATMELIPVYHRSAKLKRRRRRAVVRR